MLSNFFNHLYNTPLFGISLTLLAYQGGLTLYQKSQQWPLFNPVLIAVATIIISLKITGVSYQQYWQGAQFFSLFNGIVVVALALPLYRYLGELKEYYLSIIVIIVSAAVIACLSSLIVAKLFGLDTIIVRSVAARSVTTPIAVQVTEIIHGNVAIITMLAILNGISSSILAFPLLKKLKVTSEVNQGLCIGVAASAIGTALAFTRSYRMGSYAALGMILNGIVSALIIPLVVTYL